MENESQYFIRRITEDIKAMIDDESVLTKPNISFVDIEIKQIIYREIE